VIDDAVQYAWHSRHVEHEEAFNDLVRDLDAYHEYLRFDRVTADVASPAAWRAEIRRQARQDRIPMWSFVLGRTSAGLYRVTAGKRRELGIDERGAFSWRSGPCSARLRSVLSCAGHVVRQWLRCDGNEAVSRKHEGLPPTPQEPIPNPLGPVVNHR
jgi:hypothetical protein